MILNSRGQIPSETLFSSTTYKTDYFDRCIYCHEYVESDYYDYNGEYIGQPHRCNCKEALKELEAKEQLYKILKELEEKVDKIKIDNETKNHMFNEINRAYEENSKDILDFIHR